MNNCPINSPSGVSNSCPYSKEGLCDYPYEGAMSAEQIKETTRKLKEVRGAYEGRAGKVRENDFGGKQKEGGEGLKALQYENQGGKRMKEGDKLVAKWQGIVAGRNLLKRLADSVELAPPAWWWKEYEDAHRN